MSVFQGFLIGFTAASALGPIAVLVIHRTLRSGWWKGAASGVGVALADGLYGLAGALGLNFLTSVLIGQQHILRLAGGVVLIYLGIKAFRVKAGALMESEESKTAPKGLLAAGGSIFLLTLTNPMTMIFFSAVYAGISTGSAASLRIEAAVFAVGVFFGSLSWWLSLSAGISLFRSRFSLQQLGWLNKASGLVITGFGIWILVGMVLS